MLDGDDRAEFAEAFVDFVRGFGLLDAETTPCGAPMSSAEAHAITILRNEGLHQGVLGERIGLGKSSTSRLVDGLAQRGWVRRAADPHDGRARILELTDKGHDVATEVVRRRAHRLSTLLENVPADRRRSVVEALRLLTKAGRHDAP
jgi:DNA-binding MarR family transcriptional regulator